MTEEAIKRILEHWNNNKELTPELFEQACFFIAAQAKEIDSLRLEIDKLEVAKEIVEYLYGENELEGLSDLWHDVIVNKGYPPAPLEQWIQTWRFFK